MPAAELAIDCATIESYTISTLLLWETSYGNIPSITGDKPDQHHSH